MSPERWQVEQFERNRPHLREVARRILGSYTEADDAVQEAWLRLGRADTAAVENLRGWLTTVVSRICLDMLRARQARREEPIDGWPPDVVVLPAGDGAGDGGDRDPEREALLADSVGLAMLVVLDTLTPAERLAFVLHDMFGVPFEEIAPIVERSLEATRQLASRARRRVHAADLARPAGRAEQRRVVEAFLAASRNGDFEALLTVLHPDVVFRADAGQTGPPAPAKLRGADHVARLVLARGTPMAPFGRPAIIGGRPGAVVVREGRLFSLVTFAIESGRVVAMDLVVDPVKLRAVRV
jgi:RNA polymerase sigma-70 factor (ECF subfamily)